MSTPKPQNEPTMEEILASIRKIISEDAEAPAKAAEAPTAAPAPSAPPAAPAAAPPPPAAEAPPPKDDDAVLELTDVVKDDGSVETFKQPGEDLMMTDLPEPAPAAPAAAAPAHAHAPAPRPLAPSESELLSGHTAAAAASALAGLADVRSATRGMALGNGNKTIEDIVRELLRPMLKDWLDSNLPPLVERLVQREITKLAGQVDDR